MKDKEDKKNYNNIEVVNEGGLKCDNPICEYKDNTPFEDYEDCIGKPCPECGDNLLTEEDYARSVVLRQSIDLINSMSPDELKNLENSLPEEMRAEMIKSMDFYKDAEGIDDLPEDTKYIKTTVSTHGKVKAVKVEKINKNENEVD